MLMRMLRKYGISADTMHSDKAGRKPEGVTARRRDGASAGPAAARGGPAAVQIWGDVRTSGLLSGPPFGTFEFERSVLIATDVAARGLDIKGLLCFLFESGTS